MTTKDKVCKVFEVFFRASFIFMLLETLKNIVTMMVYMFIADYGSQYDSTYGAIAGGYVLQSGGSLLMLGLLAFMFSAVLPEFRDKADVLAEKNRKKHLKLVK